MPPNLMLGYGRSIISDIPVGSPFVAVSTHLCRPVRFFGVADLKRGANRHLDGNQHGGLNAGYSQAEASTEI